MSGTPLKRHSGLGHSVGSMQHNDENMRHWSFAVSVRLVHVFTDLMRFVGI